MDKQSLFMGWLVGRRIAGQLQRGGEIPAEWETVLETTVTTAANDSAYGINAKLSKFELYDNPDWIYRVTVGDESIIEVPRYIPGDDYSIGSYYPAYILGNRRLMSAEHEDSGGSFCITDVMDELFTVPSVLTTRTAGTYRVKVEKLLKAPVAYSYNSVRLPKLPEVSGYSQSIITISASGAARLIFSDWDFDYSVSEHAFYAYMTDTSKIEYIYDSVQGHTDWVRNTDGDMVLAEGEKYTVAGETLIWASYDVFAHNNDSETAIDGSKPVPVFDYKEW